MAGKKDGNQDLETVLNTLENIDPSKNKQYVLWLCNQYINGQFSLADENTVNELLNNFTKLKNRLAQKDINRYTIASLNDIISKNLNIALGTNNSDTFSVPPNTEVLYNGPLGMLAIPKTEEASIELGRGTKWCTSATKANNKFNEYTHGGKPIYIWRDKNGNKYQFYFDYFLDDEDEDYIDDEDFDATDHIAFEFKDSSDDNIKPAKLKYFRTEHPVLKKLFAEQEDNIAQSIASDWYQKHIVGGRWPALEKNIINDAEESYLYAKNVIKGRWPEAEPTIAKDRDCNVRYARNIIGDRWPEAEPYIIHRPSAAYYYAKDVIKGRWPEAERYIKQDPFIWPEYEKQFLGQKK